MNVIFHIDEVEKWDLLIANVKAMNQYGQQHHERFHIELLANADAVVWLTRRNDSIQAILEKLSEHEISIKACHHSLVMRGIEDHELYSFVEVVETGVVELAMKQKEGFAYIKP